MKGPMAIKEFAYGKYEDDNEPLVKLKLLTIIIEQFVEASSPKLVQEEALAPKEKGYT